MGLLSTWLPWLQMEDSEWSEESATGGRKSGGGGLWLPGGGSPWRQLLTGGMPFPPERVRQGINMSATGQ